jgi:hypothetical protein
MPKKKLDQLPADAVPLAEAFERFTDPQLLEALRQLEAAGANTPPREVYGPYHSTTNPRWGEYQRALSAASADFRRRLSSGELLSWGRDTPWGLLHAIPPDAWAMLAVVDWQKGIVRGPKPAATRLYGVVVAGPARVGRPSYAEEDEPFLREMHEMILAAERNGSELRPYTAAMGLIEADRVPLRGALPESVAKRLATGYKAWLAEKFRKSNA